MAEDAIKNHFDETLHLELLRREQDEQKKYRRALKSFVTHLR